MEWNAEVDGGNKILIRENIFCLSGKCIQSLHLTFMCIMLVNNGKCWHTCNNYSLIKGNENIANNVVLWVANDSFSDWREMRIKMWGTATEISFSAKECQWFTVLWDHILNKSGFIRIVLKQKFFLPKIHWALHFWIKCCLSASIDLRGKSFFEWKFFE